MENDAVSCKKNPLETEQIGKLILKYSLPAIASSLVSSIYNIVDQIFVGNKIVELGNAATNVAFPLVMIVTTLAMTFGAGSAASFSLYRRRSDLMRAVFSGDRERRDRYRGIAQQTGAFSASAGDRVPAGLGNCRIRSAAITMWSFKIFIPASAGPMWRSTGRDRIPDLSM